MRVLAVAVSARMLAEWARADGHTVLACDRFGDLDTRAACAAVRTAPDNETLTAAAASLDADAVLYGAGLENRPDLVDRLAAGRELLGVPAEALPGLRDPWVLADLARRAGAQMPETLPGAARAGHGPWLRKPRRGGGGRGIRRWRGGRLRAGEVLQRRVDGVACSALALGDGRGARLIGLSEQLLRGYRWCGNTTPPRLPASDRDELAGSAGAVADALARERGVRGVFGIDLVWDGYVPWVLEVNPRPPASLELFGAVTFADHAAACRGDRATPGSFAPPAGTRTKLVCFAAHPVRAPDPAWWPAGLVHDLPPQGQAIAAGAPVCTLIDAADPAALAARGAALMAALPSPVHG